jgi:ribosome-associated toxin RatA of RatAB toxin-antitoxin module
VSEQATERMTVRASPQRCFDVVVDFERYPEWASDIKEVRVLEADELGRPIRVHFRAAAFGRSTSYTLEYNWSKTPEELSWMQVEGDITSHLDGAYVFEPSGDHGEDTEVVYHLFAELTAPLPAFVKRRAEGRIMSTALKELKARAESPAD